MGTFSIWHWAVVLIFFGVPILAIATENSGKRVRRGGFAIRLVAVFVAGLIPQFLVPVIFMSFFGIGGIIVAILVITFFFYRAVVQRLRDAGNGKGLAYVGVVPVLNFLIAAFLLVAPSKDLIANSEGTGADFKQEGTA